MTSSRCSRWASSGSSRDRVHVANPAEAVALLLRETAAAHRPWPPPGWSTSPARSRTSPHRRRAPSPARSRRPAARRRDQLRRQPGPAAAGPDHGERRRPAVAATGPVPPARARTRWRWWSARRSGRAGPRAPSIPTGPGPRRGRRWSCGRRSASRSGCFPSCRPGCSSSAPPTPSFPSPWGSSTSPGRWSASQVWSTPCRCGSRRCGSRPARCPMSATRGGERQDA